MKYLVTGTEMKYLDSTTSLHFHVPEVVLMEQAAATFVQEFLQLQPSFRKGIVFCGAGNNGGDGIAIARLLNEYGIFTEVCFVCETYQIPARYSELFSVQKKIYDAYAFPVADKPENIANSSYDFVIDAIFGTGLSRELNESYLQVVTILNQLPGIKVAVDIPSGICADNGKQLGGAVFCDYTITFSFEKIGHFLWPGNEYTGTLICKPIGITSKSWLERIPSVAALEFSDFFPFSKRQAHSNKGTYGKLLIIAGSKNMAGAAILAAKAAYRSGIGLVNVYTQEENRMILQTAVPEAILSTYKVSEEETFDSDALQKYFKWADAIVIGPGIGTSSFSEKLLSQVIKYAQVPLVLDADALNLLAKDIQNLHRFQSDVILTPHLGEMARLTKLSISQIQEHFIETAAAFSREYGVTCVLKDFHTIIAGETLPVYLNLSGNHGMATAGSGDVLTGIIGTFLAQGIQPITAAAYGVFLHGLAGDMAVKKTSAHGMCAQDIIEGLKEIWNKVEQNGNR